MAKDTIGIISLIVSIIVGFDALTEFINNVIQGVAGLWTTLSPLARIVLVILVIFLVSKRR